MSKKTRKKTSKASPGKSGRTSAAKPSAAKAARGSKTSARKPAAKGAVKVASKKPAPKPARTPKAASAKSSHKAPSKSLKSNTSAPPREALPKPAPEQPLKAVRPPVPEAASAERAKEGGEQTKTESFEYQMQPIILIVPKGAAPSAIEQRKKEAEVLRERVQTCESANSYFKSMQNAAIRDMVTRTSADLPGPLRELLDKTPIGHLTAPEVTKQGVEMVALCGRKPTTVDTPKKREIRETMYTEKYEKKSTAYLQEIRKAAMIEYR